MDSEQIGINMAEQGIDAATKIAEFLSLIAQSISKDNKYNIASKKGPKAILDAIKRGEDVRTDFIDAEDQEIFKKLLKVYNVPYMSVEYKDPESNKLKVAFYTRGYDAKALNEIRERYLYEMNVGQKEITVDEFLRNNNGNNIKSLNNLDASELELLRQYASEENIYFTVVKDKINRDKYEILYIDRDKDNIKRAVTKMEYDFSGKKGRIFKKEIEESLDRKKRFYESIQPKGNETIFIVDTKEPKNFITVNSNGIILHSLEKGEQINFDGTKESIISDKNTITFSSNTDLMKYVTNLHNPVVLNADEMTIVKGLSKTGEAILQNNDFKQRYESLKNELSNRKDYFSGRVVGEKIKEFDKIYTKINIPQKSQSSIMDFINNNHLEETSLADNCIAYTDVDKEKIETFLDKELYKGLDDIQKFEAKIFYEGRGHININNNSKTQYLFNCDNPSFVLKFNEQGLTIIKDGHEVEKIERDDNFNQIVKELVKTMNNPVALTKEEMEVLPEEKIRNITNHLPENQNNQATDYLKNKDITEKEILCKSDIYKNIDILTERQKETLEKVTKHEVKEYHIDRNIMEIIEDQTFSKKTVRDTEIKEEINH